MEYKDYYELLEIEKHASTDDIRRAYRKLARKYHPDVNQGDEHAEDRFKEINESYEVLIDPDKRAKYDQLGASWHAHQRNQAEDGFDWEHWTEEHPYPTNNHTSSTEAKKKSGFSDFFHAIFGNMGKPSQEIPRPGRDYHQQVEISLEEAFRGTARILRIGGRRIEVRIPKGATQGTKVRIRGEGSDGKAGGPKGDLYLEIEIAPHPMFERKGNDLHLDLPIDLYTAVLGGEAIVPTFKGKVKLKIPPETQSGRVFRLRGQGMPRLKQPDERGDLYAKVMIHVPDNLTEEEIELFEELADIRGL